MLEKPNHTPEYLLEKLRDIALPEESRTRMRAALSAYADFHTVRPKAAPSQGAGFFAMLHARRNSIPAALLLFITLTGGTAFGAEKALPGTILYPVKIHVTEPVQLALTPTLEGKAEVHAELAERRLEEATVLALTRGLDEGTQGYLEAQFGAHVDESLAAADTLAEDGREVESLDVRTALEAKLVAHADILGLVEDRLEETGEEASTTRRYARDLLNAVKLRKEIVSGTRLALERDLEDSMTETETLALVTRTDASLQRAAATGASDSDELPRPVERHLDDAEGALIEAKESLESDRPQDARRAYRKAHEAERASEVANILFEKRDLLKSLEAPATTTDPVATTTEAFEGGAAATTTVEGR